MLDVDALSTMIADIVSDEVGKAVAPLNAKIAQLEARPAGSQMDDIKGMVEVMISDAFVVRSARAEPPQLPDFTPMIEEAVSKAVAALPVPQDGKDAANIVEALKDSGELVLTLQDGRLIRTGIRDGEKGKDGFGFDDMDACVLDDDRTIELSFKRDDEEKAFTFKWPTMIYRDVFKEGSEYQHGDVVTWGGSLWHCNQATKDKPGTDSWTLAAKKGRDGKDAKVG